MSKGLEMFAAGGEQGLRVDGLARALNISKSGFYCHFKDRADLLENILEYWAHEFTEVVTDNSMLQQLPARERLLLLMTMVFEQNLTEYDAAVDMWSRSNPIVAGKRKQVIDKRLKFVRNALIDLGFTGDDLEMRTRLLAGFQMGEAQIFGDGKKKSQKYRELRLKLLIGETA